ncbi:MAG: hypothetical protein P0Y49_15475 [Candidatus Pedobacter colombiensis]|uniref:Integrase catalytic domain-containing protein n=1 Tax=Candidatus Pedobacter colombiensis TaxID=3121371 RepID=A0AAJ5W6N5_9SPHI|nr:hypothetical protein [Pedobacter sp.]WEK18191.1 MAG: hypothetical protein P0Y49_15475 [Pedobacter sp.]
MQFYNNTLCISYGELVGRSAKPNLVGANAFISKYDYINLSKSGKLIAVRRGGRGTEALYDFESLPMPVKNAVALKYKDILKSAQQEPIKQLLVSDYKALGFFTNYVLPNGTHLKEDTIREYVATAVALNAIAFIISDTKAWRKALGGSSHQSGALKNLMLVFQSLQPKWGWKLPAGERALRDKINKYKLSGYESLISAKFCNVNAAKVFKDEQEGTLRRLMALAHNFDDVQVMKVYNMTAEAAGWKKISRTTVANKRNEWKVYVDAGSRGKVNHDNVHAMQVKRRAPKAPLLYWTIDGWDVELLYQQTLLNKDGHAITTYHNRLTVVVVLDPCQKYPIGYAIGTHETPALIRKAIRNAVKHTAELFGELHMVYQLQTDRYGKGGLTPFYEAVSTIYTPARAKNAKAKVIEPYFKYLNKNHCQLQKNWSGFGMTAKKEHQPNIELLNKTRHSFPDRDGCTAQIEAMIRAERALRASAYIDSYKVLGEDQRLILSKAEFLYRLGESSGYTNRLNGNGITFQLDKRKYTYDSFDPEFRKKRTQDWQIRYDPDQLDIVLATSGDGSLRFMLTEKYEQPMALAERITGDQSELDKINRYNRGWITDILDTQSADYASIAELMDRVPAAQETLGKLLITDSNGQHKDHKSQVRIGQKAERLLIRQEQKAKKDIAEVQLRKREAYLNSRVDLNDFLTNN